MASFRIIIQPEAEKELRACPFPFRRQLVQALHKLKTAPIPPDAEAIEGGLHRRLVHGWNLVYEVDDASSKVTVFRIVQAPN